ncbi:ParB/RepB/Spo0J family partition protein [Actinomycetes bacterium M1A6_2h]
MVPTTVPTATVRTYIEVDPATLDVNENVRDGVVITDDPDFLASIAAQGVLQAVSAVRRSDGTLAVHDGQRRTLAAREVGLASIPVVVREQSADEKAAGIERIIEQVVANDQRDDLTKSQRAAAVAGLFDLGMSTAQVATALHVRKDYAEKAGRAGRSERARRQLDDRQLTLDGAALLADLEDAARTQPWIAGVLEKIFTGGYGVEYQLRNLERRITERAEAAEAATEYTDRGFALLHDEPSTAAGEWFSLADLRTADGHPLDADAPEQAPHLWHVHVDKAAPMWVDKKTRDRVNEDDIDFDTEGEADAQAQEGMVHFESVEWITPWNFEFFLRRDHRAEAGFEPAPELVARTAQAGSGEGDSAAHAEAERVEVERAERRKVKTLNRAGATATETRRTFLTALLSGKATPKNATKWMVTALAAHGDVFTESKSSERYADIMGSPLPEAGQKAESATVARAEVLLLARVLTAFEARLTGPQDAKDYWRFASKHYRGMVGIDTYLTFLADSGRTLSPVEQAAMNNITVDAAHALVDDDA